MARILLFHSILGLRGLEREAAERLRAAGHAVTLPDLFDGETAATIDEGFALHDRLGWERIAQRAEAAAAGLPPDTVLAGVSMGASVAAHLWANRPEAAGILFLHGVAEIPASARPGLPLQIHLAEPDPFEEEGYVGMTCEAAAARGLAWEIFRYPGLGHLFTDATVPDHDPASAALLWQRVESWLASLDPNSPERPAR